MDLEKAAAAAVERAGGDYDIVRLMGHAGMPPSWHIFF
jgi:hypothetical protein